MYNGVAGINFHGDSRFGHGGFGQSTGRTVLHLVTRTAHIRSVLTDAMTQGLDRLEQIFADGDRLSAMLNLASPMLSPLLTEAIRAEALRVLPAGVPSAFSERVRDAVGG